MNAFLNQACQHFSSSLNNLPENLSPVFEEALDLLQSTQGHVICCGMGKSGLIAKKIAATFASTGIPAFFLHPAEALHGDLGMVTPDDTLLLISNSGETAELNAILPSLTRFGNRSLIMTGRPDSTLGHFGTVILPILINRELCPNDLAPTTSTLLTLAAGDLLAVAMMERTQFGPTDFAKYHPGGSLGRRLLMRVNDLMVIPPFPTIHPNTNVKEALITMSEGRLGMALVYDQDHCLGVFTDGDLRRALLQDNTAMERTCADVMTHDPITIPSGTTLAEAEDLMTQKGISVLLVKDKTGAIIGLYQRQA